MLQESCNLDPSCALRKKKKSYLHSSQINKATSKKILDIPPVSFNLQDPNFELNRVTLFLQVTLEKLK